MISGFILFTTILLAVLLGAHFLLYVSIVRFFAITNPTLKLNLFGLLLFLSLSFPTSFFLIRLQRTFFTEVWYLFAACWIGLLINLTLALTLIWLVVVLTKLAACTPNIRFLSMVFFAIVAAVSAYGTWNAFHPRLKPLEIAIEDLPQHWRNKTIVHLSDVHLGAVHRAGFLRRIIKQVNPLHPDLILITGDLFDGMGANLPSFIEPLNTLKASKGVFFVTGNHEGYLGTDKSLSILKKTLITVLDNEVVDVDGLQIMGVSFPEPDNPDNVKSIIESRGPLDSNKPSILMYHTPTNIGLPNQTRNSQHWETYWFPNTNFAFAKENGIDLQLSGHTHQGQLFPFRFLTRLIYKGYDYGLHKDGRFTLYTTSGVGTWGPPMRIGGSPEIVVITLK